MNYDSAFSPITSWAEQDRPREKLLNFGANTLSHSELIAILLGSGSKNVSALELSKTILDHYQNDLNQLGRASVTELTRFKGIGQAKAICICSAMEIGRRKQLMPIKDKPKIQSSAEAYACLAPNLIDLRHEVFKMILLNRQNKVLRIEDVSSGGVAGTVVDPKMVFKIAVDHLASSIILSHNHPSGNLKPSQADLDITKKIKAAGELLEIKVLDHLIISNEGYFSFADEGLL